ncbi:LYR family of Fe/S cluster biogenesis protein [Trifolium repens]|nr:LYR family of Fe/S cluster biogenesis protein [Trifolium repens]
MRRKWASVWNLMENFKLKPKMENVCGWRLLHEGPDTVEELLDRHLVKKVNNNDDEEDELLNRRRLTSTRREALSLYRDILRASRFFTWPDSKGVLWRDLLRDSARKEFELARFETDQEIVTRLLIGGREAVHNAIDKLAEKQRQQIQKDRGGAGHDQT